MGEKASVFKARKPLRRSIVDVAGIWGEGHASYPGRSVYLPVIWLGKPEGGLMDRQKSADPIVAW